MLFATPPAQQSQNLHFVINHDESSSHDCPKPLLIKLPAYVNPPEKKKKNYFTDLWIMGRCRERGRLTRDAGGDAALNGQRTTSNDQPVR